MSLARFTAGLSRYDFSVDRRNRPVNHGLQLDYPGIIDRFARSLIGRKCLYQRIVCLQILQTKEARLSRREIIQ